MSTEEVIRNQLAEHFADRGWRSRELTTILVEPASPLRDPEFVIALVAWLDELGTEWPPEATPRSARQLEAVRQMFLAAIEVHSEECWSAGWMSGIEQMIRRDGGVWIDYAYAANGWPIGYRAEGGWAPLDAEEIRIAEADLPC